MTADFTVSVVFLFVQMSLVRKWIAFNVLALIIQPTYIKSVTAEFGLLIFEGGMTKCAFFLCVFACVGVGCFLPCVV